MLFSASGYERTFSCACTSVGNKMRMGSNKPRWSHKNGSMQFVLNVKESSLRRFNPAIRPRKQVELPFAALGEA